MDTKHGSDVQTRISLHWLDALEEYNVRNIALDLHHDAILIEQLRTRPDWMVEFVDEEAIFFVRDEMILGNGNLQ